MVVGSMSILRHGDGQADRADFIGLRRAGPITTVMDPGYTESPVVSCAGFSIGTQV